MEPRIRRRVALFGAPVAWLALLALGPEACHRANPARERVLTVLSPIVPAELDPTRSARALNRIVFFNIFEPLVRARPGEGFEPVIAESWTNPTADVCSIRLRAGVRFHDGTILSALDVVKSLEAARQPGSVLAGSLTGVIEIATPEPQVVTVRTSQPALALISVLAAIPIWKPGPPGQPPLGTGPYRVAAFQPGAVVKIRRATTRATRRPLLDGVDFQAYRSAEEVEAALAGPEAPVVLVPPESAIAGIEADRRYRLQRQPGKNVWCLAFDLKRSPTPGVALPVNPFLDVMVRRAFRLALDLDALARESGRREASPASQLVPPGAFGFDARLPVPYRELERAQGFLRRAGYARGFDATLDVPFFRADLGEAVARQLGELGVRIAVRPLSGEHFARSVADSSFRLDLSIARADALEALTAQFHTRDSARGLGALNYSGYSSAQVDRTLEVAAATPIPEERAELLRRAIGLVMEDLPWVPLLAHSELAIYPRTLNIPVPVDAILNFAEAAGEFPDRPAR